MRNALTVLGFRPSMVGDLVMAVPLTTFLRNQYDDPFINWVVAAKCSQAAPLFINHPNIDRILVSSTDDGYGPELMELARRTDIVFDPSPQHPTGDGWVNESGINIYSETFRMSGFPVSMYRAMSVEDQMPTLCQWFRVDRRPKTIAVWPSARQGEKENRRVPPLEWWQDLSTRLHKEGYGLIQCGHPAEFQGRGIGAVDVRHKSFMENIEISLGCDAIVGTDSGSMVALAAYHSVPSISLLCPHWPGHTTNPLCFGPLGKHHRNLWAPTHTSHSIDAVTEAIKEITS